jgi:hypothetical protein
MSAFEFCILLSGLAFLGYSIAYFTGPKMKAEFKRFGLEKYALMTVLFEIIGALGLLTGYFYSLKLLLELSAIGLSILMLLGVLVRLKVKDGLFVTLPAFFFFLLNAYIAWYSIFRF